MARPKNHDGRVYARANTKFWWMRYMDREGKRQEESTHTADWDEAQQKLRERLEQRDGRILEVVRRGEKLLFSEWADFFLANYSQPPLRAPKTHEANMNAFKNLKPVFGQVKLSEMTAEAIEDYLRARLKQRKRIWNGKEFRSGGTLQATSVHQEFRVLRRSLSVAVKRKLLAANPCSGVEFPVAVKSLFRPHYVTWSEQQQLEFHAPAYLKNAIRIITETGLRVYKELTCLKKEQVDLSNSVVWIPDSKTPNGVAEVPLTAAAVQAFSEQWALSGPSPYLFPSDLNPAGHQTTFKTAWHATLRRAKLPYFRIYDLRSTFATRLSAGGVADEWVTQLLRQGEAKVFKKYSQMKLQMKREALEKLNRAASESRPQSQAEGLRPN